MPGIGRTQSNTAMREDLFLKLNCTNDANFDIATGNLTLHRDSGTVFQQWDKSVVNTDNFGNLPSYSHWKHYKNSGDIALEFLDMDLSAFGAGATGQLLVMRGQTTDIVNGFYFIGSDGAGGYNQNVVISGDGVIVGSGGAAAGQPFGAVAGGSLTVYGNATGSTAFSVDYTDNYNVRIGDNGCASNPNLTMYRADGTINFSVNGGNGNVVLDGDLQVGGQIGVAGDTDLLQLSSGSLYINGQPKLVDTGGDHYVGLYINENNTDNHTLSIKVNDASRTLSLEGNTALNQDLTTDADVTFSVLRSGEIHTGQFKMRDLNQSNYMLWYWNEDDTADREFAILVHGGNRELNMYEGLTVNDGYGANFTFTADNKNLTVEDNSYINQDVTSDADVTFNQVSVSAGEYISTDTSNYLDLHADSKIRLNKNSEVVGTFDVSELTTLNNSLDVIGDSSRTAFNATSCTGFTDANFTAFGLTHETSGDMTDGLGIGFSFNIEDSAGVSNNIAWIGAQRNGTDTTGKLEFWVNDNGGYSSPQLFLNSKAYQQLGGTWAGNTPTYISRANTGLFIANSGELEVNGDSYFSGRVQVAQTLDIRYDGVSALDGIRLTADGSTSYLGSYSNPLVLQTFRSADAIWISPNESLSFSVREGGIQIGNGVADTDYTLTFDGETNDGVLTWMEDEDYFESSAAWRINTGGAANVGLTIKSASGQTANLQEWQDSSGDNLALVDATGHIISTNDGFGQITVRSSDATPTANQVVGITHYAALNDGAVDYEDYARLQAGILDPTEDSEYGTFSFYTIGDGVQRQMMTFFDLSLFIPNSLGAFIGSNNDDMDFFFLGNNVVTDSNARDLYFLSSSGDSDTGDSGGGNLFLGSGDGSSSDVSAAGGSTYIFAGLGDGGTNGKVYLGYDGSNAFETLTGSNMVVSSYLRIGSSTTYEAFYQDEGDLYSEDGKAYFGAGINAVAERYGVAYLARQSTSEKTLPYLIDATFTAATATILKVGETFVSDGVIVGDFLVIADANDTSYIGSVGEIIAVTETTIIVSIGAAGAATPDDLTAVDFVVYNHPIAAILDNGDIHFQVGVNPDASFKIHAEDSNNDHAVHYDITAGIDGNSGLDIEYDAHTYGGTSAMHINFDATAFASADTLGTGIDVVIDNTGATAGDIHCMDVALSDPSNTDIEVEAVATHEGVDPVAQYLGDPAALDIAFSFENASYTDRTIAFNDAGTDVQIFAADNDFIILGSTTKWDEINVVNAINASHTIIPTFHYIEDDGDWIAFTPADDSVGFSQNGTIRFDSDNLTTWGQRTINEVTGAGDNIVDYYWIKITRTRNVLPTPPTEDTIQITTLGTKHKWDKDGNIDSKTIAVTDGITAPSAIVGQAIIYVDTADGDLKVKFGDGTVKTLATD